MTPKGKRILGIIAEYNPFHNGHLYHMEEAKRLSGCDYVIVAMSGDFVQRGTPALLDKYTRARFALEAGADLVLELPAALACGSAEFFARGAVGLLHRLGIVDTLCFGCENADLASLSQISEILADEPDAFRKRLQALLRSGCSYPLARQKALAGLVSPETAGLLAAPNNTLAVEYLKALSYFGSCITPLSVKRIGSGYHEASLSPVSCCLKEENILYPSATAIRNYIHTAQSVSLSALSSQVPDFVYRHLTGPDFAPVYEDDFSDMLCYALKTAKNSLTDFQDVSQELADRLQAELHDSFRYSELAAALLSKGYTATRISRALLHILLGVTTQDMERLNTLSYAPYARILGIKKESSSLLRSVSENDRIPLITKIADAKYQLSAGTGRPDALHFLEQDIAAAELYNQAVYHRHGVRIASDYFYQFPVI